MQNPKIDELFEQTLAGSYDEDSSWSAVHQLRQIGTREVFVKAADWCKSLNPLHRARGADVLAQIGCTMESHKNAFQDESFVVITELLIHEVEPQPLASAISALGHIYNPEAVPHIVRFTTHQDCEVRFAVACALGHFPNDPLSVQHLLILTQDSDHDVRDWAIFGLGDQGDADTPEICEAFILRIIDPFEPARMETIIALSKRQDIRVIPCLVAILERQAVARGYIEAACYLLEIEYEPEGWSTSDYVKNIAQKYSDIIGDVSMTDPLWYEFRKAVYNKEYDLAESILQANPKIIDMRNGIGETVLHYLTVENDGTGVAWLHSHGFGLNTKNKFGTPVVFEVAQLGYKELLLWFAQQGVDFAVLDGENQNIVTFLNELDEKDMAQFVLDHVTDPALQNTHRGDQVKS